MKVIFNADDFGLTEGVNDGIIDSFINGVVRSTTLMVGMGAEMHALKLAQQHPKLKIGLHLRFTAGAPLTKNPLLTRKDGNFPALSDFWKKQFFDPQAVRNEVIAQIEHFLGLGLKLSHIDSHHHVHTHPQLAPIIYTAAKEYQVPLRGSGFSNGKKALRYSFTDKFYDKGVSQYTLIQHLTELKEHFDIVEIMCHPAIADKALLSISSYYFQREEERRLLTSPELKRALQENAIGITDYSELLSS
ncbi:chitin disaccharide deacetylase [Vibrio sp. HA2012]|uniref:chitin disaccharide deacetylase n=1 Tax=Vibrio sp. HA2012 TaxID=1971595 RepID=UPI000C2C66AF|nr:chitin disaccharide deacetylase [Vibrio sp. HA2012]PJC87077.1 chitin disaccharide deacetylase [Vibrio sp. HA2012]